MILPTTYTAALLLTILSMICWGSWANTQKLVGKWRFELFYYDYALGVLLCALLVVYTFGTLNSAELTFSDNFLIAGYRKMAWGVGAGVVFNLANLLLVAAIALAGMAVAFPISIGLALVIGVVWNYVLNPQGNPTLLFLGALLVVVAIVVDAFAYAAHADAKLAAAKTKRPTAKPAPVGRGIIVSLVSGVLMGVFYPMVEMGKAGEDGVSPYGIVLLFAAGVFFSTFFFNLFFLYFPVQGEPIEASRYFRGTLKNHLLGVFGGAIWCVGGISNFLAASSPRSVAVGPAVSYAMGQGATMISALWGLLVWKEFSGSNLRVKLLIVAMLVLFAIGLTLVAIAPLHEM